MANVYSASFASFPNLTGQEGLQVPTGYVWVIRDIAVWCDTSNIASAIEFTGSEGQIFFLARQAAGADNQNQFWSGRVVLQPSQGFYITVISGEWDVTVCGYALSAP
jgi:hypothetical protein